MTDIGPLRAVLAELPAPGEPITDRRPYLKAEAPDQYVIQGAGYLPVMDRLWKAFRAAGFPVDGQYQYGRWVDDWVRDHPQPDPKWDIPHPEQVAIMSREDCFNYLRFIQRQERFGDGLWAGAHEVGLFHALAERLIELGGGDKRDAG